MEEDATNLATCAAKCGSEQHCHYFAIVAGKTCSRYNGDAKDCSARHPDQEHTLYAKTQEALAVFHFTKLGVGYCAQGYYAGWQAEDGNLQACKARCEQEEGCHFFALYDGKTCSRYDARAGDCSQRVTEGGQYFPEDHTTYAKTEKATQGFHVDTSMTAPNSPQERLAPAQSGNFKNIGRPNHPLSSKGQSPQASSP